MPSMVVAPSDAEAWRAKMYRKRRYRQLKAWQTWIMQILDHYYVQTLLFAAILVSLYVPDACILTDRPSSQNLSVDIVILICMVVLAIEIALLSFASKGYLFSFFFWADIIGTFSFVFDIHFIQTAIIPSDSLAENTIIQAARAARLGIRYGRLARLVQAAKSVDPMVCCNNDAEDGVGKVSSTPFAAVKKVSETLSAMLSKQVIVLVLVLMVAMPFLQYTTRDYSPNAWIDSISDAAGDSVAQEDMDNLIKDFHRFYAHKDFSPISLDVGGYGAYSWHDNVARDDNKISFSNRHVKAKFDFTRAHQRAAAFDLGATSLLLLLLVIFSFAFRSSIEELVVSPLDRMMVIVRNSANLMLKSLQAMDSDDKSVVSEDLSQFGDTLETEVLEQMLEKLTSIVGHVLPGSSEKYVEGAGADKDTASWLNQQYNGGVVRAPEMRMRRSSIGSITESASSSAAAFQLTSSVHSERLNQWSFDVLECNETQLYDVLLCIYSSTNAIDELSISVSALQAFSREIGCRYLHNPYHNFKHGVDVCHTTYLFLSKSHAEGNIPTIEKLAVLLAAYAHDVGHPGVNNAYLVNTKHELAFLHNDKSPLENMHCTVVYEILRKPESNVFQNVSEAQWRDARKVMLSAILGTDMVNHFDQISKLQVFVEVNGEQLLRMSDDTDENVIPVFQDTQNRIFFLEMLVHCADISNPIKSFNICEKWAYLVCEEFFAQGEKERSEGLPISAMMDQSKVNIPVMQCNFIDFVITPLYLTFIRCIPPFHVLGTNLANNFEQWGNKRLTELRAEPDSAEEITKLEDRITKFKSKLSFTDTKM